MAVARRKAGVSLAAAQTEMSAIAARLAVAVPRLQHARSTSRVRDLHDAAREAPHAVAACSSSSRPSVWCSSSSAPTWPVSSSPAAPPGSAEMAIRAALGATREEGSSSQLLTETLVDLPRVGGGRAPPRSLVDPTAADAPLSRGVAREPRRAGWAGHGLRRLPAREPRLRVSASALLPALTSSSRVEPEIALKQTRGARGRESLASPRARRARGGAGRARLRPPGRRGPRPARLRCPRRHRAPGSTRPTASSRPSPCRRAAIPTTRRRARSSIKVVDRQARGAAGGGRRRRSTRTLPVRKTEPSSGPSRSQAARRSRPGDSPDARAQRRSRRSYVRAMGMPLLRGRELRRRATAPGADAVVLVSRSLAERFFPGDDAVGHAH